MSQERQAIRVAWQPLQRFTAGVLERWGMPPADAATIAEVLVDANLRGVDTHGVLRLPIYEGMVQRGQLNPRPNVQVLRETPGTMLVDCDLGLGHAISAWAMRQAMRKAQEVGVGWVQLRRINHQGALYYYSRMAALEGMVGLVFTATGPVVTPYGGAARAIGNTPFSFAAPAGIYPPLVLDVATSIVAYGKVRQALNQGTSIPPGWAIDKEGNPTTDPAAVVEGALLPMAGHKGSGLSILMEAMAGILAGTATIAPALTEGEALPTEYRRARGVGSAIVAVNVAAFADPEEYRAEVDQFIARVKGVRRAPGFEEILMPGELEHRTARERQERGVPLHPNLVAQLREMGQRLGVGVPGALEGE